MYDTRNQRLKFTKKENAELLGYTDSDWANNQENRKSMSGYMFFAFGNLVSWKSAQQTEVALSSGNAEYVALSEGAREALFFRNLWYEIYEEWKCVKILCDNRTAIKNAESEQHHKRSKHINIKYHHIKDEVEKREVKVSWVCGKDNVADLMTKPVSKMCMID